LPLALGLAHRGHETLGLGHTQRLGEALGEILVLLPRMAGGEGDYDVYPFAAGKHREAGEAEVGELLANVLRGLLDVAEIEPFVWVEIEHHPVGFLHLRAAGAPAVELDRAHLNAGEQARGILDIEIVLGPALLLRDRDMMDVLPERAGIVLLEKALARPPLGTAHQADRAKRGEGKHQRRDAGVVVGEIALGLPAVGEDYAAAVGYLH